MNRIVGQRGIMMEGGGGNSVENGADKSVMKEVTCS